MKEINNIDEMYTVLEKISTTNYRDVEKCLNNFLKSRHDADRKIWCEYVCLQFRISDGRLNGVLTFKDDDNNIFCHPNLNQFNDEDFGYIESRIRGTNNDILKFRYSTILCSKYPHQEKAKIVIDSSWNIICNLEQEILQNNKIDGFFLTTIINSYRFSYKFRCRQDRIKNKIIELINNSNFWNKNLYLIPCGLINHILSEKKNFKGVNNLNDICWSIFNNIKSIRPLNILQVLELGEKCDSKDKKYNWRLEMAKIHETEMNNSEDASIKAYYCLNASTNYKLAGKNSESEILLEKYVEFPPDFEYVEFHEEIENWPALLNQLMDYADEIVKHNNSNEILMYLMNDPRLTEYQKSSLSLVEKTKEDFPLLHMFPIALRDENGFVIKKIDPGDEADNHATMQHYSGLIRFAYVPFITRIINSSYIEGKLSPKIILEFLRDETWVGWDEILCVGKNDFLSMIVPIINNYFQEWELLNSYELPYPHFSLFIDSLILKIEGILKLVYGIDNEIKESTEDGSVQDKSLNKILEDDNFDLIPEDDLFFLRYLLIDKSGLNLRNKVAHSLMKKEDYNLRNANLLFLALLKLCSFQLIF